MASLDPRRALPARLLPLTNRSFPYVSPLLLFFPPPFFFWLGFQSKGGFCSHGTCGRLWPALTFKATSQFQPGSTEGWSAQSCSNPTCAVGRVGDAASPALLPPETRGAAPRHKSPRRGSPPPTPRIICSFLLEILPVLTLVRLICCRSHFDQNPNFKTLIPFNNNS